MSKNTFSPTLLNSGMGDYAQSDWHDYYSDFINLIPHGVSVLDVGSGRGGLAQWLTQNRACMVTCVDGSSEAVESCQAKGLATFQLDLNSGLADMPGHYDLVLFSSSLESLLDPCGVVRQVRNNLKPDGRILIWLPNFSYIGARLAYLRGVSVKCMGYSPQARALGIWGYDDIQFFTKASLDLILREAGYTRIEWHLGKMKMQKNLLGIVKGCLKMALGLLIGYNQPELLSPYLCVVAWMADERPS